MHFTVLFTKLKPGGVYKWKLKADHVYCIHYVGICEDPKFVIPGSSHYGIMQSPGKSSFRKNIIFSHK